jgi:hypothetical protein
LLDGVDGSLRAAVLQAQNGDTVQFADGLAGQVTLTAGEVVLDHSIRIEGPGADVIQVSGNHGGRVFNVPVNRAVSISGLTVQDGALSGGDDGGGILNAGLLTVTDCALSGNAAQDAGGALYNTGNLTLARTALRGNEVRNVGGALFNSGGSVSLSGCDVSGNSAGYEDGGIDNVDGPLTLTDCTVSGNTAFDAAGVGNSNARGVLTVTRSVIAGNTAGRTAGGILNGAALTLTDSVVRDNAALDGAGVYNASGTSVAVAGCAFSGNQATRDGGGLMSIGHTVSVLNSTFSGNSAGGQGGGVYNFYFDSRMALTNTTVSGNSAGGVGGGVATDTGPVTEVRNCIVAGNAAATSSPDVARALASQGHNLIGDGSGGSGYAATDLVGTAANPLDPGLGPLQDNGGPTATMAPLPGSPALNAGDAAQLGTRDQRGVVRGGGVNVGAYQATASAFVVTAPAAVTAGEPFDVVVTAVDVFGQVAAGYSGTVYLGSTDPQAGYLGAYALTLSDGGSHTFAGAVLLSPGPQTLYASDDGGLYGSWDLTVG